jgi:putative ABC transport system permease protein
MIKDLQYAVRTLLKRPGFLFIAIATLALGIGATTAMFTVVNSVLLRPLQFPEPDRLVLFQSYNPKLGTTCECASVPDIVDWQQQSTSFKHIAGFYSGGSFLGVGDETERVRSAAVTADFFPLLGTAPLSGRVIQASDTPDDAPWVVVIGYGLWQRRFGGAADVLNREINFNGHRATIVGVMPAGFNYPDDTEIWYGFPLDAAHEARFNRYVTVLARLKPGLPITQAQSELDTINQRLAQAYFESNNNWGVRLFDLRDYLVGKLRTSLFMLFGAVGFVLLIAGANVANLTLARAAYRQKEIALRTALGASRFRIVRQLLTESVLLWVVSGAVGLVLSVWLIKLLIAISPPNTPRFDEIRFNWLGARSPPIGR